MKDPRPPSYLSYENRGRRLKEIEDSPSLSGMRDFHRDLWEEEVVLWSAIVRTARAALLMSQIEFASAVGISPRTVNSIEAMEKRARGNVQYKIREFLLRRQIHVDINKQEAVVTFRVPLAELRQGIDPLVLSGNSRQVDRRHQKISSGHEEISTEVHFTRASAWTSHLCRPRRCISRSLDHFPPNQAS